MPSSDLYMDGPLALITFSRLLSLGWSVTEKTSSYGMTIFEREGIIEKIDIHRSPVHIMTQAKIFDDDQPCNRHDVLFIIEFVSRVSGVSTSTRPLY